ncbi:MAG: polysaccharide deacetylase family protein [Gemmatimonadetes bacterium]|nr:polysaccharide deacetylase family protein [Gemmatimonadota bacterium]
MRRHLKSLLGWLAIVTGLYRPFLRNKAVIVLFHRVDDGLAADPISCSRRRFQSFCDFFRRYFRVVSLGELVTKLRRGDDVSRHLVITFDDGYRDNLEVAAAELTRRRLPACFFIATGFIGTERTAPWDAENGVTSRWMSWDDVRRLHRLGFEVGAHTVHHVDLGRADRVEAVREIAGSKERSERELGAEVPLFSYPFGGRENITEVNRAEVREAGFACCLSAYGGTVTRTTDLFNLQRIPVSAWYATPFQFAFEVMLER